ncbi:MAG: NUDIX domain-containing protein [Pyrinomonadaceae bacterium]|nr:NUDIX domain-containing protein [Pyrinomonadaceae bacterium]
MRKLISKIWQLLPCGLRVFLVRLTQERFTASVVVVVFNQRRQVLLLDHWLRAGSTGWALPGGFICKNEQPLEALRREIFEETGLKTSNERLLAVRTRSRHIEIVFSAESFNEPKVDGKEIRRAMWFSADEIPVSLSQSQKDFIRAALNLKSSQLAS